VFEVGAMLTLLGGPILYAGGSGLSETPNRVCIVVKDCGTWYHHDTKYAFEWKRAAEQSGYHVSVYVNG
jgi:hypothetical protein